MRCKRLVSYTRLVGKNKVRRYSNEEYWAKPVTGFGDTDANLLIIGLAPGAHGANRTGRLFTGDHSGQWLMKALYEIGFSNNPSSISAKDGLILKNVFITSCLRCAPPSNKPVNSELVNCSNYLVKELEVLKKVNGRIHIGYLIDAYKLFPVKDSFFLANKFINKLAGNDILMKQIREGKSEQEIRSSWQPKLTAFKQLRKKYLLYKDFE